MREKCPQQLRHCALPVTLSTEVETRRGWTGGRWPIVSVYSACGCDCCAAGWAAGGCTGAGGMSLDTLEQKAVRELLFEREPTGAAPRDPAPRKRTGKVY